MNIDRYADALFSPATFGAAFAILILLAGIAWTVLTSGSIHAVRFRVWRLVYGKVEVKDAAIAAFLEEQIGLMSFRFHSGLGLRIRTSAHAERLIGWLKKNGEDIAAIRRAGDFFDVEALCVVHETLDDAWTRVGEWIAVVLTATAIFLGVIGIVQPNAIVKIVKTDHWVVLSPTAARRLLADANVDALTPSMCAGNHTDAAGLEMSGDDIAVLCDLFAAADKSAAIADIVTDQRYAFAFALSAFGMLLCVFGVLPLRRYWAGRLRKRLARRPVREPLELAALE